MTQPTHNDFTSSLDSVISIGVIKYAGCLIEVTKTGFAVHGRPYSTLIEAKEAIDKVFTNWNKTIKQ